MPLADKIRESWGCSSAGRAPRSQRGGQRFDPAQLHQTLPPQDSRFFPSSLDCAAPLAGLRPHFKRMALEARLAIISVVLLSLMAKLREEPPCLPSPCAISRKRPTARSSCAPRKTGAA